MTNKIWDNDYIYSVISKIMGAILGISYSAFFSRYFQTALRGEYSVLMTYSEIIVTILCFGMYQGYPYFKKQSKYSIYFEFINMVSAIFLVYLLISIIGITLFWGNIMIVALLTYIPLMFGIQQLNYIVLIENPKIHNTMAIILSVFDNITIILFYFLVKPDITILIIFLLLKEMISFIAVVKNLNICLWDIRPSFHMLWKYMRFGIFPMITIFMMDLNYKADLAMLNYFRISKSEIGIYSLGLSLSQYIWMIPDALKDILLSKLVSGKKEQEVCKISRISNLIVLLCEIFLILTGKLAIILLYGNSYLKAYKIMVILFAGVVGMVFYKMIYSYNVINGKQKVNLAILTGAAVINISINYFTIPRWGIEGAAFASAVSYFLCGIGFLIYFVSITGISFSKVVFIQKEDVKQIKNMFEKV